MSYRDFLGALPESEASEAAEDILGRRLTKADFESDDTVSKEVHSRCVTDSGGYVLRSHTSLPPSRTSLSKKISTSSWTS